jgi:hypothetical protein
MEVKASSMFLIYFNSKVEAIVMAGLDSAIHCDIAGVSFLALDGRLERGHYAVKRSRLQQTGATPLMRDDAT